MGSKARTRRRAKTLRFEGGVCSSCGASVPREGPLRCGCGNTNFLLPDEDGWVRAVLKRKKDTSVQSLYKPPTRAQRAEARKKAKKDFDVEIWIAKVTRGSYYLAPNVTPKYIGDSGLVGAKAGKRKGLRSYAFVVEPVEPLPFDEPTKMLWHGTQGHLQVRRHLRLSPRHDDRLRGRRREGHLPQLLHHQVLSGLQDGRGRDCGSLGGCGLRRGRVAQLGERRCATLCSEVQAGMPGARVKEIMGSPTDSQHQVVNVGFGPQTTDCWYWSSGAYQICFRNGNVDIKARY